MKTIPQAIRDAQLEPLVKPRHQVTVRDEVLHFTLFGSNANASLDAGVPQSFAMRATAPLAYAAFRFTNGQAYLRVIDTGTPADYALSSTGAFSVSGQCMRNAVFTDAGGASWLYAAATSGVGNVQVRRAQLTGTSNPLSPTLSDYGPAFGWPIENTSTRVRRVEAVCAADNGAGGHHVIVCVGTHDFTAGLSTLQFYWLPDASTVIELNALIQLPLATTYVNWGSNWYGGAQYCTFVSAIWNAENGSLHVFANDQVHGRAVSFYIKSGIESALTPIVPIAPEASLLSLWPCSLAKINGLYHLTARFVRRVRVGDVLVQSAGWDLYLRSADCVNWSFAERSSFLTKQAMHGALLMRSDSPATIYYAGGGYGYSAPVTPLQVPASSAITVLDDYLDSWGVDETADTADSFGMLVANPSVAGGGTQFANDAHVKRGGVVYVRSGYDANVADYGAYGIDDLQLATVTADDGEEAPALAVSGRDIGHKRLIDYNLPVETDLRSRLAFASSLRSLDELNVKTPQIDVECNASGLVYKGLNDPFVGFVDAEESGDALMEATVQPDVGDNYSLSSIGFIFGASEDGSGNVMLLPKNNNWMGYLEDRPRVRRLNLKGIDPQEPDKLDTGWNFAEHVNGLWQSVIFNGARTAAIDGAYRTSPAYILSHGFQYDVAVRVSGRRVQLFTKPKVTSAAQWASNAGYVLRSEFLFDWQARRSQPGNDYCGLALGTDVFVNTDAFAQAVYDDIEVALTGADELTNFSNAVTTGVRTGSNVNRISNVSNLATLIANGTIWQGQYIRIIFPSFHDAIHRVLGFDGTNGIYLNPDLSGGIPNDGTLGTIYDQSDSDDWAYADSGYTSQTEDSGRRIIVDPKGIKHERAVMGRALFVSDDNTAFQLRWVRSDGIRHVLQSGSDYAPPGSGQNGGTKAGWDITNPLPSTVSPSLFWSGSEPSVWRMIFHHGFLFDGAPSAWGLPSSGFMIVDDEVFGYGTAVFNRRGMRTTRTWTVIPHFYFAARGEGRNATVIRKYWNGTQELGDNLSQLAPGMLVEILGRNGIARSKPLHLLNASQHASPSATNISYITLDIPYENEVRDVAAGNGDLVCVSRRGQFGTEKKTHDAGAPVRYFPCDTNGNRAKITVSRFACYSGLYQCIEDAVKHLAALAGQRAAAFRNHHTSPATNWSGVIGSSPTSLPLQSNLANFVLEGRVHIPGNSTTGSGVTSEKRLNIYLRGYYRLTIQQYTTAADYAAGRPGVIRVGLATTSADISPDANGDRWLKHVPIPDTDFNVAGSVSGSNPNYTLTEDVSRLVDLRVIVQGNLVAVEINRKPFWTFNLDDMNNGTVSWRRDDPGPIQVEHTGSVPTYTATLRVLELGDELPRHVSKIGSNAASNINTIVQGRHIRQRSGQAGSVEWSRFWTRDDLGTLQENIWKHLDARSDTVQVGHQQVNGLTSGEWLDESFVANEGYRFGSADNESIQTNEAAAAEAQLQMRESAEFTQIDTVEGVGLLQAQPEDRVGLAYAPGGDAPTHALTNHVITSKRMNADKDDWKATYTLRAYRP